MESPTHMENGNIGILQPVCRNLLRVFSLELETDTGVRAPFFQVLLI